MTDQLEMLDGLFDGERPKTIQTIVATSEFLNTISTGMIFRDASGQMVDCNHAAETILGVSRASLLGKTFSGVGPSAVHLDGSPFLSAEQLALDTLRSGRGLSGIIAGITVADGSQRWVSMRIWPFEVGGATVGVMSAFDDVTAVVREQRVIQILAGVKRVGLMNVSEAESLQLICDLVVHEGHLPLAWVGVASTEGGVDIVASAGVTEYLYDGIVSWWGSSPSGLGPTGTALRTGVSQVVNDLSDEPMYRPWKDRSGEFGLSSAVALPFSLANRKAVITIYDTHVNGFDARTVDALEGVASTIGANVVDANAEYEKRVAMEATLVAVASLEEAKLSLSKSEQWFRTLVAKSSDLIVVIDEEARLRYTNPFVDHVFGYEPNSQIGRDIFELIHPDDHAIADEAFVAATSPEGMDHPVVLRFLTASGEWRFIEGIVTNCLDDEAVRGVVGNGRDVTDRIYLTRALKTLSEGSQVLVHAQDEATLIREISQTIVSVGSYPVAWVGYVEHDDAKTIRITEPAGILETLTGLHFSWGDGESGQGPVANAVRSGEVQVIDDLLSFPLIPERRTRAERYGLRSMCSFPLKVDGETIGVVSIYSEHVNSFRPSEVETLGELVDELAYGIGRLRDAQRLSESEALMRSSDERFRLAFEHNMAPMLFSDFEDRVIAVNDSFCHMVGFTREELMGHDSKQFTFPDDVGITEETLVRLSSEQVGQVRYVKRYLRKDGRVIISEVSRSAARDASGKVLYFVSSERDVTEERTLAEQLSHQALHDSLTGLANRALFEDRLAQAHARVLRQGDLGAVLLLDLDDFKGVNDAHGHLIGDQLLAGISQRFELVTRSTDTLSRFGGDEFLYLAEGLNSVAEAEEVATRLIDVLAEPFSFDGISLEQHASVGIVVWDNTCENPGELIQKADVAMYEAKRTNRGRFSLFTPSMHQEAVSHFELVQQLRRALQTDDLTMHYQPIVDLDTVEVVGFEALMRWRHGDRGWIRPDVFIPLAEKSDLILELGAFALTEAVTVASSWKVAAGATPPYVAVNFSAHQFHDPGLVDMIDAALTKSGLAPQRLVIEITESAMLLNVGETMNAMSRISAMGVGFALDDFGTGYSSLSYLALLQPTIIKIDQSFVSPAEEGVRNDTLLEAIISLGQKLGMTMSAEGIETRAQFERLQRLGCDLGQGYLWSPAIAGEQVEALLSRVNGRRTK
jgi:diguanylate cyclase (GGDEF)-like protein/PAS domain S-box-containing protein